MTDVPCEHNGDAVGWVLGALPAEEAERFAAHLDTCAACRDEVAKLTDASERLAEAAPLLVPPPELRDRLIAAVRAEASPSDAVRPDPGEPRYRLGRSRRRTGGLVATVTTLAVVIVAVVLVTSDRVTRQPAARNVPGAVTSRGGAGARAVVQIRSHTATLIVTRLAAPPAGRVYQAWVVRGRAPANPTGALFSVPQSGDTRILLPSLQGVTEVIVTAESPRGSATPTLPPIVLVHL